MQVTFFIYFINLKAGNISVNKRKISFVSIDADHACEHINMVMKIRSELISIPNHANDRQRFFMAEPQLACLYGEFKSEFGVQMNLRHLIDMFAYQYPYQFPAPSRCWGGWSSGHTCLRYTGARGACT